MTLRWLRSWPAAPPADRAHVDDNLPKLTITDFNYATAGEWPSDEPGICMLEWDIALGRREREAFASSALEEPERVLVAPYDVVYEPDEGPVCVHRDKRAEPVEDVPDRWRWWLPLQDGETSVDLFGFGCIYLPRAVIVEFNRIHLGKTRLNDTSFSYWHLGRYGRARVTWEVHPQHLHGD